MYHCKLDYSSSGSSTVYKFIQALYNDFIFNSGLLRLLYKVERFVLTV